MAELRKGRGAFAQLSPAQRASLANDFCQLACQFRPSELTFICAGADKANWFAKNPGRSGYDLYAVLFEQIASRFDLYLRRRHAKRQPSKGMVIVDPHTTNLSASLKQEYSRMQRIGTRWSQTYNLIESALFLNSHDSPGLQLADLCAYSVFRLLHAGDAAMATQVRDLFDREPASALRNAGKWHGVKLLELMPEQLGAAAAAWP